MTNRSQAKRITLGAQVASVLLAGGAVAVAALGLPIGDRPEFTAVEVSQPEPSQPGATQAPDSNVPDTRRVDFTGIVERLGMVGNAPTTEQPPVSNPGGGEGSPTPGPQPIGDELRYLGMIEIGARRSAMLVIDGKQRIVRQGESASDASGGAVRVQSVQPGFVVLNRDGARQRLEKAERQATGVTTIERTAESARRENERQRASAVESADGEDRENPRADFERRRREAIDRALEEGRITQEEAQRMLDRMNNSTNNRRGRDD